MEFQIWDGNEEPRDLETDFIDFTNNEFTYTGTDLEQTNVFDLKTNGESIFERQFDGSDPNIVGLSTNVVMIPNHLFESGQNITYNGNQGRDNNTTVNNIGIATTVSGIGLTDKLPNDLFTVKISNSIGFCNTLEDALMLSPKTFELTSVGIGTFHRVGTKDQDQRALILIDNMIQSPISNTNVTTQTAEALQTEDSFRVVGINSFFPEDYIQIDDEYMKSFHISRSR